MVYEGIDKIK